ncbi:hypothetical protein AOC05_18075 [Arthrobacter alpinus]|uniref:Uncharacterized protein n=1 Tax=Arthrobacter alpinus TaxID=656366 RepID=A0A0M4QSB6_9MICC|nr:hypothetical protein [Arthrobacter alpinus]ALE93791.1 hypothetical protein AOC05_18075 [Arthrobacter alpinus]
MTPLDATAKETTPDDGNTPESTNTAPRKTSQKDAAELPDGSGTDKPRESGDQGQESGEQGFDAG